MLLRFRNAAMPETKTPSHIQIAFLDRQPLCPSSSTARRSHDSQFGAQTFEFEYPALRSNRHPQFVRNAHRRQNLSGGTDSICQCGGRFPISLDERARLIIILDSETDDLHPLFGTEVIL